MKRKRTKRLQLCVCVRVGFTVLLLLQGVKRDKTAVDCVVHDNCRKPIKSGYFLGEKAGF